ncbi:glycosyltransferase family 2 protein [Bacillus chungangensis]|uniref:Glycosyltransferase involved in cell wall biosynthesis n=1 Tax=Bacillus chungangensis TaxID=587633 RepID=A0ABT9WX23_9BACI|nr:glycosyltransferase family 2 protein [Bacillus chungangensis]MDQ0177785.1 glycosyltransferase involved in cell wall biosynthesis [Bacillus chungangensis]
MESEPQLVLSMAVKNEENRYLKQALTLHKSFVDHVVIIDDASTDQTVSLCEEMLETVPHTLIKNETSMFHNEKELRKKQWEETTKVNPKWILVLDADEIFESTFATQVKEIISSSEYDAVYFRLFDMWSETHYRDDQYWQAHHYYRPFLVRYRPEIEYEWKDASIHCGRFPKNIHHFPYTLHSARIKHYGWARKIDRIRKYERYNTLDPNGEFGWKEQYESILDPNPHLVKWEEHESL